MFENVEGELVDTRYRMEVIGQYHQAATEVVLDQDNRAVLIEPGMYPVVASVSLDRQRISEGGVIFDGFDTTTAENRTLVHFHSASALRDLARSGSLNFDDTIDQTILEERALAVAPIEARLQAIRR